MRSIPAALAATAPLTALAGYHLAFRPWHLAFGAPEEEARRALPGDDLPEEEARRALPGDDLLPAPTVVSTRAVGLDAPGGGSRLLVRNRWTSAWSGPARKVLFWGMEPSAFVMEQRMLRAIKQRVEADPRSVPEPGRPSGH